MPCQTMPLMTPSLSMLNSTRLHWDSSIFSSSSSSFTHHILHHSMYFDIKTSEIVMLNYISLFYIFFSIGLSVYTVLLRMRGASTFAFKFFKIIYRYAKQSGIWNMFLFLVVWQELFFWNVNVYVHDPIHNIGPNSFSLGEGEDMLTIEMLKVIK